MADLTRFDFNAKSFLTSETVRRMSDAEVGQYVLLLAEAWLCGKDTTLPDDLPYLARLAHADRLSEKVAEKFPIVQTEYGPRRRNDVLFAEWQEAQRRSMAGREKAEKRWGGEKPAGRVNANFIPVHQSGIAADDAHTIPNQAVPDHTNPIQTSNTTGGVDFDSETGDQGKSAHLGGGDWGLLRSKHRRIFGRKPDKTFFGRKFEDACKTYGEEVVLACFDEWAPTALDWVKRSDVSQPLHAFFKKLPDMAVEEHATREEQVQEAATLAAQEKEKEALAAATDALVLTQMHAHAAFMDSEGPKPNEGDPEAYFEDVK